MRKLTGDWPQIGLTDCCQVAEEVASVESLSRATETQEDERLVAPGHHHVSIGLLPHGKDVRGHVFPSTASEHLNHLGESEMGSQESGTKNGELGTGNQESGTGNRESGIGK